MHVPCQSNLTSQSFNSEFIEFVWQFPRTSGHHDQLICHIGLNPTIYMEAGVVDENGDWTSDPETLEVGYGHLGPEAFLTTETFWSGKKFPTMYGAYFDNGKKLVELVGDVVEYLKSV